MKEIPDRLLEALEHPERLSDAELDQLLSTPEALEYYRMLSHTADALMPVPEVDTDAEWQKFAARHTKTRRSFRRRFTFRRVAAAVIVCAAVSAAVVATNVAVQHTEISEKTITPKDNTTSSTPAKAQVMESEAASEPQTIIFKDERLSAILSAIALYYGVESISENPSGSNIRLYFRWDQSLPLSEILEQLNSFEQINITFSDNTITLH